MDEKALLDLLIRQVELVWWSVLRGDTPRSMQRMLDIMRAPAKIGNLVVVAHAHPKQPQEDRIGWLVKVEDEPYGIEDGEPSGYTRYWTIERLTGGGEIRWTNVQLLRVLRETQYDHASAATTPRTDAVAFDPGGWAAGEVVRADFARELEREINDLRHDERSIANHSADLNE